MKKTEESKSAYSSKHHLAVLDFKITSIDWLALMKDGHQRARILPNGEWKGLVP